MLPGLIDVHVHISMNSPSDWRLDHYRRSLGTDAGSLLTPHGSAGREVANLGRIGFTPLEAIRAATETPARLLKIEDRLGALKPGKLADLIVVRGNVEADLSLLEGGANMSTVMLGGRRRSATRPSPPDCGSGLHFADVARHPVYCAEHITNPSAAQPACDIWLAAACVRV